MAIIYMSIYEKEKLSKDWLISYPSGLILIPDHFEATTLFGEIASHDNAEFDEDFATIDENFIEEFLADEEEL